jgi:hypothetical protein
VPSGIADAGSSNARQLAESGFDSPETARGKSGFGHMNKTPELI